MVGGGGAAAPVTRADCCLLHSRHGVPALPTLMLLTTFCSHPHSRRTFPPTFTHTPVLPHPPRRQVKSGSLFDNILVADDLETALQFARDTWGKTKEGGACGRGVLRWWCW